MWIYIAHCHKVSNALGTLVPAEKPSFQTLSEGLIVLLCTEVIRQGVSDHGVVYSECSSANSGHLMSWHHHQLGSCVHAVVRLLSNGWCICITCYSP